MALVDTGIGLADVRDPEGRIGRALIDVVGWQFNEADTAIRQLAGRGVAPADVRHLILTHLDPDHTGGIADFPDATVHLAAEEHEAARRGHDRYLPAQFAHGPRWCTYGPTGERWFDLPGRRLDLGFASDVLLIPLFGHTAGHCGVAIRHGASWHLHVGDAYYLRAELTDADHPIHALATARAVDNPARLASLDALRRLARDHAGEVTMNGYHDVMELPSTLMVTGGDARSG